MGISSEWQGKGLDEVGINKENNEVIIRIDKRYFRPTDVTSLIGDSGLAHSLIGWEPKYSFHELVREMIDEDLKIANRGESLGFAY